MPKIAGQDEELEKQRLDKELDREFEATFPASDAPKITRKRTPLPPTLKRRIEDQG